MRRAGPIGFAAAAAATLVLGFACDKVLGIDGPVSVESVACNLPTGPGSCRECVSAHCCAQAAVCAYDPGCKAYESCNVACGADYACRAQCLVDHPTNADAVPVLDHCIAASCATACSLSCGVVTPGTGPDAAVACTQCTFDHACTGAQTCAVDLPCERAGRCFSSCRTRDCQNACLDGDGGALLFGTLAGIAARCLGACAFGSDWTCLGNVAYPATKSDTLTLTLTLSDLTTGALVTGANVRACQAPDVLCTQPVAPGAMTDAQGNVTLSLVSHTRGVGFGGFLEITSPGVVPYLGYLGFPLSEPNARLGMAVPSVQTVQQLGQTLGALDPTRAHVVAQVGDCLLDTVPGAVVEADGIDAQTRRIYVNGNVLDPTATQTDGSGLVFFLNAPAGGQITLHVTPTSVGRVTSTVSVLTRAGAVSGVFAYPTP
jgi:hypothetical protein